MPAWKHTLDLKDIFHSEAHSFANRRDIIVKRIKNAPFWEDGGYDLLEIAEELSDAPDAEAFDHWWNDFYDWCDTNRVWVETR
jgi:hypothetical protein